MTQSVDVGAAVPNPRVSFIAKTIVCNGIIHASSLPTLSPLYHSSLSAPHSQTVRSIFVTNGIGRLESCVGVLKPTRCSIINLTKWFVIAENIRNSERKRIMKNSKKTMN